MNREEWEQWSSAIGANKKRLLAKLMFDNEPLARYYAVNFAKRSSYYTENMEEDLLQAARIGIIRALPAWEPDKGGFSAVAFWWAMHEMQLAVRHATGGLSVPKDAFMSKGKQDEIAKFKARYGYNPEPGQVGLTQVEMDRASKAIITCVPVTEAENVPAPLEDVEGNIDRKRDIAALQAFVATLTAKERKEFWTGKRADLTERAKAHVEGSRKPCRT